MTILYLNVLTKSRASSRGKTWKTSVRDTRRKRYNPDKPGRRALGASLLDSAGKNGFRVIARQLIPPKVSNPCVLGENHRGELTGE